VDLQDHESSDVETRNKQLEQATLQYLGGRYQLFEQHLQPTLWHMQLRDHQVHSTLLLRSFGVHSLSH
jgi:hypothetical protein